MSTDTLASHSKLTLDSDRLTIPAPEIQVLLERILRDAGCEPEIAREVADAAVEELVHLAEHGVAVATARAGNVIGGGDWARDRIIPDSVRALAAGERGGAILFKRNLPTAAAAWTHARALVDAGNAPLINQHIARQQRNIIDSIRRGIFKEEQRDQLRGSMDELLTLTLILAIEETRNCECCLINAPEDLSG